MLSKNGMRDRVMTPDVVFEEDALRLICGYAAQRWKRLGRKAVSL